MNCHSQPKNTFDVLVYREPEERERGLSVEEKIGVSITSCMECILNYVPRIPTPYIKNNQKIACSAPINTREREEREREKFVRLRLLSLSPSSQKEHLPELGGFGEQQQSRITRTAQDHRQNQVKNKSQMLSIKPFQKTELNCLFLFQFFAEGKDQRNQAEIACSTNLLRLGNHDESNSRQLHLQTHPSLNKQEAFCRLMEK